MDGESVLVFCAVEQPPQGLMDWTWAKTSLPAAIFSAENWPKTIEWMEKTFISSDISQSRLEALNITGIGEVILGLGMIGRFVVKNTTKTSKATLATIALQVEEWAKSLSDQLGEMVFESVYIDEGPGPSNQ